MKSSFWTRDLALALLGYFLLFLSVTLFYLFPVFLEEFHPSRSRVGFIMGIQSVTAILVRPFFGRMVDERGGRMPALFGVLLMILVVPFYHMVQSAGLLPFALRACMGAGWGIAMTATMAICSDLAPLNRLAHSIGIIGVAGIDANDTITVAMTDTTCTGCQTVLLDEVGDTWGLIWTGSTWATISNSEVP